MACAFCRCLAADGLSGRLPVRRWQSSGAWGCSSCKESGTEGSGAGAARGAAAALSAASGGCARRFRMRRNLLRTFWWNWALVKPSGASERRSTVGGYGAAREDVHGELGSDEDTPRRQRTARELAGSAHGGCGCEGLEHRVDVAGEWLEGSWGYCPRSFGHDGSDMPGVERPPDGVARRSTPCKLSCARIAARISSPKSYVAGACSGTPHSVPHGENRRFKRVLANICQDLYVQAIHN